MQMRIIGYQFLHLGVGLVDVLGITGQCHPAKGADTPAKQRADVFGHEAWDVERLRDAGIARHLSDVVTVIEHRQSHGLKSQQTLHMFSHRGRGRGGRSFRIFDTPLIPLLHRPALRQIAVDRIMRRSLIGQGVRFDAARQQLLEHVYGIGQQSNRDRPGIFPG